MWVLLAFGSAFFAGVTSILAKCGIRRTDSTVATAIRTCVVLVAAWGMACLTASPADALRLDGRTWVFLILSGLATGGSWLCYFRALQLGDVNRVVPIDKSSTVLTILAALVVFHEPVGWLTWVCIAAIAAGTYLMITRKDATAPSSGKFWWLYAAGSAVFASLTAIFGKLGMAGVDANLGTALRTGVVLIMAWVMVAVTGKGHTIREIPRREWGFLILSGLATGASWLCYYRALQEGVASVVVPIDKLSILVTVVFSRVVFRERLTKSSAVGLLLIVAGTLGMLI